ncbi:hypothetical protein C4D60_Mb04t10120 [Musa balbisiana]|uniref:Uncharacterized protein n=1 Tax=Musa balbisiana TaxID=52838 RepID=A0A4S8KAY0_MUSBA|nr:hypothetical protein C4D60_Mb04t10120 [Musa balbisiana]
MASRALVEAVAPSPTAGSHGESALAHVVRAREDPTLGIKQYNNKNKKERHGLQTPLFSKHRGWFGHNNRQMRDTLGEKHGDHCADAAGCSLTPASLLNRDLGACSGGWSGALDPWLLKCILSSSTDPLSKVWLSSLLPELSDIPLPRTNRSRLQPLFRNLTIKGSSPNKAQRTEKATKSPKATWAPAPATAATS